MERHETDGPGATEELAGRLAQELGQGDVVLIAGELGSGKTTFVRGAARALGVSEPVTSPTFTIGQRYEGRIPLSHLDLYRLEGLGDEDPALLDDYLTPDAIAFIEWPEPELAGLERVAMRITLTHAGGDRRRITVERPA